MEILDRIFDYNLNLLEDMVEIKYSYMMENLFRFFRGTCHLFYEDLQVAAEKIDSPLAWICGDLHIENFGSYKADNKLTYFDLNDFDEAILAPASWETVRTVASIFVAFNSLKIEEEKAERMARQFLRSYSQTLACGKARYLEPRTAKGIVARFLQTVEKRTPRQLLEKKTELHLDRHKLRLDHPKHKKLEKEVRKELLQEVAACLQSTRDTPYNYDVVDAVFRIAGTGSVGLKRYAILLRSKTKTDKFLLLDMKQVRASSLTPFVKALQPSFSNEAERVIQIQRRMQNMSPAILSGIEFKGDQYIIQEMQSLEDNINFKLLKDNYRDMFQVIDDMGMLTASAQLRSAGREGSATADELICFGKNTNYHEPVIDYCKKYVAGLRNDYDTFCHAMSNKVKVL